LFLPFSESSKSENNSPLILLYHAENKQKRDGKKDNNRGPSHADQQVGARVVRVGDSRRANHVGRFTDAAHGRPVQRHPRAGIRAGTHAAPPPLLMLGLFSLRVGIDCAAVLALEGRFYLAYQTFLRVQICF